MFSTHEEETHSDAPSFLQGYGTCELPGGKWFCRVQAKFLAMDFPKRELWREGTKHTLAAVLRKVLAHGCIT